MLHCFGYDNYVNKMEKAKKELVIASSDFVCIKKCAEYSANTDMRQIKSLKVSNGKLKYLVYLVLARALRNFHM
jgi:hypothetical protein